MSSETGINDPDGPGQREPRPAYHPEEGPPDRRGEALGVLRAVLYGAMAISLLAWMIWMWRAV